MEAAPPRAHSRNKLPSSTVMMISLAPIRNWFKSSKKKKQELDDRLNAKARELVQKADKALVDFDTYLVDAMTKKSEKITQEVAVEVVKLLNGDWDVAIAANKTETSKMMEGTINDLSQDLAKLGLVNNTAEMRNALKES
jgi:hypothetical protein